MQRCPAEGKSHSRREKCLKFDGAPQIHTQIHQQNVKDLVIWGQPLIDFAGTQNYASSRVTPRKQGFQAARKHTNKNQKLLQTSAAMQYGRDSLHRFIPGKFLNKITTKITTQEQQESESRIAKFHYL